MVEETRQWNAKLGEERVRIKGVVDLVEAERRRGVESMEGCVLLEDLVAVEALLFGGTEGGDDRDRTSANGDHTGVGEGKEHYGGEWLYQMYHHRRYYHQHHHNHHHMER